MAEGRGEGDLRGEGHRSTSIRLIVGRSVHDPDGARRTAESGADYLQLGHVYATASHPDDPPKGIGLIRSARGATRLPIVAVGGITPENAAECIAAGADGVAVISAIGCAADPKTAAERLWAAITSAGRFRDGTLR